jgi:hypothetical protein
MVILRTQVLHKIDLLTVAHLVLNRDLFIDKFRCGENRNFEAGTCRWRSKEETRSTNLAGNFSSS